MFNFVVNTVPVDGQAPFHDWTSVNQEEPLGIIKSRSRIEYDQN